MATNLFDAEIRKFLPLLGNEEKKSILTIIKNFLQKKDQQTDKKQEDQKSSFVDYNKYRYPVSDIKFNRDEINER
jgi:hypothetical protein